MSMLLTIKAMYHKQDLKILFLFLNVLYVYVDAFRGRKMVLDSLDLV